MAPLRLGLIAGAASIAVTLVSFGAGSPAVPSTSTAGAVKSTNPMLDPRSGHSETLLGNDDVLIAGGSDDRDWNDTMSTAEIYDLRTGKFTATSPMADSRFIVSAAMELHPR